MRFSIITWLVYFSFFYSSFTNTYAATSIKDNSKIITSSKTPVTTANKSKIITSTTPIISANKQHSINTSSSSSTKKVNTVHTDSQNQLQKKKAFCKKGIDVSYHNGDINWRAVKDSGIEFAIIRTSYGWEKWDKQTDKKLRDNINGAKSVGMPIGAYHYSYATTPLEALKEADFFIDRLKWTQWEYPVFFDFEDKCQKKLSVERKTDIILTFLQKLQDAGYYTGYYTSLNWQKNYLNMNRLGAHQLWIAHWNQKCGCEWPYGMWQYTSDGSVPGINGRVDMNYCYVDYPSIIKNLHLNGF